MKRRIKRVYEKLVNLHKRTLGDNPTKYELSISNLSRRIYKNDAYVNRVKYKAISDISVNALCVAYIMGGRNIIERKNSKLVQHDTMLEHDEKFNIGLWKLLCELHNHKRNEIMPLPVLTSVEHKLLTYDDEVLDFNIRDICDDHVRYCILNDLPDQRRAHVSVKLGFKPQWVSLHYVQRDYEGRVETASNLITFMFGAFKFDYLKTETVSPNFWYNHAMIAWKRLHYILSADLLMAEKTHDKYIKSLLN